MKNLQIACVVAALLAGPALAGGDHAHGDHMHHEHEGHSHRRHHQVADHAHGDHMHHQHKGHSHAEHHGKKGRYHRAGEVSGKRPPHHELSHAVAVLHPTEGNDVHGVVHFHQETGGVRIKADVHGLSPGRHGFHIHQYGDCSSGDGKSAGGHYNPTGHDHAGPRADKRHVGDLGNLFATSGGEAAYGRLDTGMSLMGANTIVGRGVIVHAGADDLRSQPTGAAGGRVACGVIGIAEDH